MNAKTHFSVTHKYSKLTRPLIAAFLALTLGAIAPRAKAVNASPHAVEVKQPDGTRLIVRPYGDEFCHWYEDVNGFSVVTDRGRYVYARAAANGGLAPTTLVVGRDNPRAAGLTEKLQPTAQFISGQRQIFQTSAASSPVVSRVAPNGNVKNLVILCRFSDHTLGVHTRAPADYDTVFNTVGGDPALAPTGSVKDYYTENSYGQMTLNSTVIAWVTLPQTEAYYAAGFDGSGFYPMNAQRMVEDALNAADSVVNFAQFDTDNDGFVDAIDIVHSGYGAETGGGGGNWIWSHRWNLLSIPGGRWTSSDRNANNVSVKVFDYHTEAALWDVSGTNILRVGVIAHETGHFFGLPDLYDTDGTSEGIGSFCLMANSWGFNGSQLNPPHFSAWCKMQLGWLTPTNITPGTYNAPRVEQSQTVYRITNGYPSTEYLLVENRQPFGFEAGMPGGLAVWHIDDAKLDNNDEGFPGQFFWPENNNHFHIALLQADGRYDMEHGLNRGDSGDLYRGGGVTAVGPTTVPNTHRYQNGIVAATGNQISSISVSASNITFVYTLPVTNAPIVSATSILIGEGCTPTNGAADPGETVSVRLSLRNAGQIGLTNVTATLQASVNVLAPSQIQNFGELPVSGPIVNRTFGFTAAGSCGGIISNTFVIQAFGTNIATVHFGLRLGATIVRINQNFDTNLAPTLPTNWVASSNGAAPWATESGVFSSAPNSAFVTNYSGSGDEWLTSPAVLISSPSAQLTFSHRYNTEYGFDGGVLEISFDNGPFIDFVAAGGKFNANGYNFYIDQSWGSHLAGRDAWTGNSTDFVTTTATLPAVAANHVVRLRWRFATDGENGPGQFTGWNVDSIVLTDRSCCTIPLAPTFLSARRVGGDFILSHSTTPGQPYILEYKNNLNAFSWLPLRTNLGDGNPRWMTNAVGTDQRYFRLRTP
jgi:M6 family metalloprotease-like protein